jgi:predicted Zn-dependent peptidase
MANIKRENILAYHQQMYHPAQLIVAVAGPVKHKMIVEAVRDIFFKVSSKSPAVFSKAVEKQNKPMSNLFFKSTEQSHISLGFHALSRSHPDYYGLSLLHIILGANMSSRLFQEVREKRGLAYEIGSAVRRYQDTGIFAVNAGVDNKKVCQAIEVILEEIKKVTSKLVLEKEFSRAKEFYLGQLKLALEDTMDHMLWVGENESSLNRVITMEEVIKKIKKVKIED